MQHDHTLQPSSSRRGQNAEPRKTTGPRCCCNKATALQGILAALAEQCMFANVIVLVMSRSALAGQVQACVAKA